jgi:hypothetical protein
MSGKYEELCRKLKSLADSGVGGEKINAEKILSELMEKHGINMEDIEGEKIEQHSIDIFSPENAEFFNQIVSTILGSGKVLYSNAKKYKSIRWVETTASIAIEIESKFNFYLKAYKEQLKSFYKAFIIANKIYSITPPDEDKLTPQEKEDFMKAYMLSKNIERSHFHKQLTTGGKS